MKKTTQRTHGVSECFLKSQKRLAAHLRTGTLYLALGEKNPKARPEGGAETSSKTQIIFYAVGLSI